MKHKIKVTKQVNGGKLYFYPQCSTASKLCELMKRKALVPKDMEFLQALGYELEFVSTVTDTATNPQE